MTYGLAENADVVARAAAADRARGGLPPAARRRRDEVLTYDDVEVPEGRLIDRLREEQAETFPTL